MASMLAARFSIVTVLPRIRTILEEMVASYGMSHRIVSARTTPLCVLDIEEDPEASWRMVRDDARVPSGMLFVPSRDGISHSPEEFTEPRHMAGAVAALLEFVEENGAVEG